MKTDTYTISVLKMSTGTRAAKRSDSASGVGEGGGAQSAISRSIGDIEVIVTKAVEAAVAAMRTEFVKMIQELKGYLETLEARIGQLEKAGVQPSHEPSGVAAALLDTVISQQKFLEAMDAKERKQNVIIIGVSEVNAVLGATTDMDKVESILTALECDTTMFEHRRLGKTRTDGNPRPLLVTLPSAETARQVLTAAKPNGGEFTDIRIKRDTHPAFRKEWGRLYSVENAEKQKPENAGRSVTFDKKKRQILVDGVVVDFWKLDF